MNRAIEISGIHPVIDTVYELAQVQEAYRKIENGNMIGKIVISPA